MGPFGHYSYVVMYIFNQRAACCTWHLFQRLKLYVFLSVHSQQASQTISVELFQDEAGWNQSRFFSMRAAKWMTEGNTPRPFSEVTISPKLWWHNTFRTQSVKDWPSPVERKVRQRDFGRVERGGDRKERERQSKRCLLDPDCVRGLNYSCGSAHVRSSQTSTTARPSANQTARPWAMPTMHLEEHTSAHFSVVLG